MQHRPIVRPDTALNPLARCVLAVLGTACAGLAVGGDGERARVQPAFDRAAIPPAHSSRIGSHNRTRAQLAIGTSRLPRGGATLAVTTCDDAGPGSLREAIGLAAAGDTIDLTTLTCGTITLETGVLATSASTLELDGPGETLLAIDGNGASQVLHHQGIGLYLTGLTIRNGMDASGYGGCLFTSGNLLMDASTITGCTAGDGSNAYAYGGGVDVIGNLTMVHSTISGNTATGTAGAIGGGAYVGGDLSAMSGSRISGNQATSQGGFVGGGGAYVSNTAMLDLATTVADNHATSTTRVAYGGGLQAGTSASVRYSMITGNTVHSGTSWAYGGGINLGYYGDDDFDRSLVFHHSTVSGNTATSNCESCSINGGGANAFGSIYSRGSTVRDNVVALDAASSGMPLAAAWPPTRPATSTPRSRWSIRRCRETPPSEAPRAEASASVAASFRSRAARSCTTPRSRSIPRRRPAAASRSTPCTGRSRRVRCSQTTSLRWRRTWRRSSSIRAMPRSSATTTS
jgi:hypothetical protein